MQNRIPNPIYVPVNSTNGTPLAQVRAYNTIYTFNRQVGENYEYVIVGMVTRIKKRKIVCGTICITGTSDIRPAFPQTIPCSMNTQALKQIGTFEFPPYSNTLTASGGASPYTYSVTLNLLPMGLSLVGDTIQGTPTVGGIYPFTITAIDKNGCTGSQLFSIEVVDN